MGDGAGYLVTGVSIVLGIIFTIGSSDYERRHQTAKQFRRDNDNYLILERRTIFGGIETDTLIQVDSFMQDSIRQYTALRETRR